MASYFPPTESTADLVSDDQAHEAFARAVKTTSSRTEHDSAVALFFDWDFDGLSSMAPLKDLQDVFATQYHWNHEHTILKSYRPDGQENEQKALSEHSRNTRAAVQFVEKLETARHTYDSDTNLLLIVFRCRGRVRTTHYKEKELYLCSGEWKEYQNDDGYVDTSTQLHFERDVLAALASWRSNIVLVLDCCYAYTGPLNSKYSLIAACSEKQTAASGPQGLIANLTEIFSEAADKKNYISMSQLLAILLTSASRGDLEHFPIHHSNLDRPHDLNVAFDPVTNVVSGTRMLTTNRSKGKQPLQACHDKNKENVNKLLKRGETGSVRIGIHMPGAITRKRLDDIRRVLCSVPVDEKGTFVEVQLGLGDVQSYARSITSFWLYLDLDLCLYVNLTNSGFPFNFVGGPVLRAAQELPADVPEQFALDWNEDGRRGSWELIDS